MNHALLTALAPLPTGPQDRKTWASLSGSGMGLALAEAVRQWKGPVLLITTDSQQAARLEEEVRFFSNDQVPVLHFPDWETLPYDQLSPHQDIISERLRILAGLSTQRSGLVIAGVTTLAQRLAPAAWLSAQSFSLKRGQRFDLDQTRQQLEAVGYHAVETVYEHGEYAVRGSLMDIFPWARPRRCASNSLTTRLKACACSARTPSAPRRPPRHWSCCPHGNTPSTRRLSAASRTSGQTLLNTPSRNSARCGEMSAAGWPRRYRILPAAVFEHTDCLLDYVPAGTLVAAVAGVQEQLAHFWTEVQDRYEERRHDRLMPILPPDRLFLRDNELFAALNRFARLTLNPAAEPERAGTVNLPLAEPPLLPIESRSEQPLAVLSAYIASQPRVLLCAESAGRRESLLELLKNLPQPPQQVADWAAFLASDTPFALTVAPLERGLCLPGLAVIAESQLFGQRVMQRRRRKAVTGEAAAEMAIRSLSELTPGAPVVHIDTAWGAITGW